MHVYVDIFANFKCINSYFPVSLQFFSNRNAYVYMKNFYSNIWWDLSAFWNIKTKKKADVFNTYFTISISKLVNML